MITAGRGVLWGGITEGRGVLWGGKTEGKGVFCRGLGRKPPKSNRASPPTQKGTRRESPTRYIKVQKEKAPSDTKRYKKIKPP